MEEERTTAPVIAMSGIIISMMFMALASGLGFAYVPIRLAETGFPSWVAAAMMPALAFGGLWGCLTTGILLRNSGHARVFMTFYAVITLSFLIILATKSPAAWILARVLYGFGINGAFIVAQSWLHDVTTDDMRGRVITGFYVSYVVALGCGSYMIGFLDTTGSLPMILAVGFVTLAILPVGLTRLRQPQPPEEVSVEIRKTWKLSPVGLMGMMVVGGLTMNLQAFAPIYAGTKGYSTADIGVIMLFMQLGLIVVQLPMGALSDRIDRRYVLIMVSLLAAAMALTMIGLQNSVTLVAMILIFAIWSGANETIYSVSSALANDRADPKHLVFLSSTLMIAWSTGAFIIPLVTTLVLTVMPLETMMWFTIFLAIPYAVFCGLPDERSQRSRAGRSRSVPDRDSTAGQCGRILQPGFDCSGK